jgi:hypothetical protein
MSFLLAFNRVYRLEKQSVMMVFSTGFANYCPSNPLPSCLALPPLSCVNKYSVYTYTVCKGGVWGHRRGGGRWNTCRKVSLQIIFLRLRHLALYSISLIFLRCAVYCSSIHIKIRSIFYIVFCTIWHVHNHTFSQGGLEPREYHREE